MIPPPYDTNATWAAHVNASAPDVPAQVPRDATLRLESSWRLPSRPRYRSTDSAADHSVAPPIILRHVNGLADDER
jgi:hypothetical protein